LHSNIFHPATPTGNCCESIVALVWCYSFPILDSSFSILQLADFGPIKIGPRREDLPERKPPLRFHGQPAECPSKLRIQT
jgi:hypothetical protein